ncbi:MAG: hypothetical protein O3C40_06630 [Planctomycetota bacterium]|nr:hypothetical protein [Planctomycetota bacterium]
MDAWAENAPAYVTDGDLDAASTIEDGILGVSHVHDNSPPTAFCWAA